MNSIQGSQRPATARRRPGPPAAPAPWLASLCAALLAMAGCQRSQPAADAAPAPASDKASVEGEGVSLKPDEIEKAGIRTTPAAAARRAPESTGYALVLTREVIAQAIADVTSAAAAERQSRAALLRSKGLAGTPGATAIEAQEAAERQATVDAAALALAERRMSATLGRSAPWKGDYGSPVLAALASGESKLVRVTFPLGALGATAPAKLRLLHIGLAQGAKSFESDAVLECPGRRQSAGPELLRDTEGQRCQRGRAAAGTRAGGRRCRRA